MDIAYRALIQIFKNIVIVIVFVSDNLSQKINFIVELTILVSGNSKYEVTYSICSLTIE